MLGVDNPQKYTLQPFSDGCSMRALATGGCEWVGGGKLGSIPIISGYLVYLTHSMSLGGSYISLPGYPTQGHSGYRQERKISIHN